MEFIAQVVRVLDCGSSSTGSSPVKLPNVLSDYLFNKLKIYKGIMKRAISMFKKLGRAYFKNFGELYRPALEAGVNPWL